MLRSLQRHFLASQPNVYPSCQASRTGQAPSEGRAGSGAGSTPNSGILTPDPPAGIPAAAGTLANPQVTSNRNLERAVLESRVGVALCAPAGGRELELQLRVASNSAGAACPPPDSAFLSDATPVLCLMQGAGAWVCRTAPGWEQGYLWDHHSALGRGRPDFLHAH